MGALSHQEERTMRFGSRTVGMLTLGMLVACASPEGTPERLAEAGRQTEAAPHYPPAPGAVLTGASSWSMAEQYTPRAGATAATGASAWVEAPPPPAFVVPTPLPAPGAQAPPPAAVANRQPAPSASAAEVVRPEAATPAAPSAAPAADPALRAQGVALFNEWACGTCHVLADAGATGAIGPSLDANPQLTRASAITVITHGSGAMPGFGGLMTTEEIAALTDYIVGFARR
jgi:mono/diheme cytochrome c family protein